MQQINDGFANADWQDKFVTMIVAVVDPQTHELTLVNAGHMAPIFATAAATCRNSAKMQPGYRSA